MYDGANWVAMSVTSSGGLVPLSTGGTNKNFTASAGSLVYSDSDSFEATAVGSSGQLCQSAGTSAPGWTTATYPSVATSAGKILREDGTNWVASTATYPDTATGTGTVLRATGTNWSATTATFPNTVTAPAVMVANANDVFSALAAITGNRLLKTNGSTLSFSQADLTTDVTGILPNANTTATSANTNSAIVARDSSGNFSAGTVTAALSGNSSTSTALAADPTDCAANRYATTIAASGNLTCAQVDLASGVTGTLPNANTTAASANTNSAIVTRDGSGNFSAGTITAALSGNATTATALAANPNDCSGGQFASAIAANGDLTCSTPAGGGDVTGAASSTDNAITRFDGTGGKTIQNSVVTISDTGATTGITTLNASGNITTNVTASRVVKTDGSSILTASTVTAAIFENLLSSNTSGIRIEAANLNCDSSSAITSQIGSWITSIGNISSGACAVVITGGIFSAAPYCTFGPLTTAPIHLWFSSVSSTGFTMTAQDTTGSNKTIFDSYIVCMGAR